MTNAATKAKALADAVNATLGKKGQSIVRIASDASYEVKYMPTGLLPIDILLQGGMPMGRFVQLHGDFSTLKTYIGLCIVKQVQDSGGVAAIIDNEHSFDPDWARHIGIDLDNLIVERPETGELAMDIMDTLIRGGVDFILVDSVAASVPQTELAKRLHGETIQPARLAQLMSTGLRRLTTANTNTGILWINQTRLNVGITFGSNEALPGGKALPYYASIIMKVQKVGKVTEDETFFDGAKKATRKKQIGQKYKAELVKSKLSKPFEDVWFDWDLKTGGIDLTGFLINQGVDLELVTISGNTWAYSGHRAVGRQKFRDMIDSRPDLQEELEREIRMAHGLPGGTTPPKKAKKAVQPKSPAKKQLKRR